MRPNGPRTTTLKVTSQNLKSAHRLPTYVPNEPQIRGPAQHRGLHVGTTSSRAARRPRVGRHAQRGAPRSGRGRAGLRDAGPCGHRQAVHARLQPADLRRLRRGRQLERGVSDRDDGEPDHGHEQHRGAVRHRPGAAADDVRQRQLQHAVGEPLDRRAELFAGRAADPHRCVRRLCAAQLVRKHRCSRECERKRPDGLSGLRCFRDGKASRHRPGRGVQQLQHRAYLPGGERHDEHLFAGRKPAGRFHHRIDGKPGAVLLDLCRRHVAVAGTDLRLGDPAHRPEPLVADGIQLLRRLVAHRGLELSRRERDVRADQEARQHLQRPRAPAEQRRRHHDQHSQPEARQLLRPDRRHRIRG